MGITISGEERDTLYQQILIRLTGIDAVYGAVEEKDWETAQRLGKEFSDLLRFVCDDLGWGEQEPRPVSLTAPPDVLRRAAGLLRDTAAFEREHYERKRDEAAEDAARTQQLQETCERILSEVSEARPNR